MEFIMPLIMIPLAVSFVWGLAHPRSFGKCIGALFLRTTKGGAHKEVSGLKIICQFIVGIVVTTIFFNIHPVTIFPIGLFWIQWIRMMNRTSKAAHPEEDKNADKAVRA
jgi:hypothetical protein